jgi:cell division protein FtsQ
VLQVNVSEREPVARIFTTAGTTFYIDTAIAMLPLSEKFSARLPVFTDFPSDKKVLSNADSSLLRSVKKISLAIQKDSFCMALIDQVDITSQRTFEFVPKIGNNIIVFGDATDVIEKLNKIKIFYKEIMTKAGWNYYTVINVQYKNEIVAKRKDAEDKSEDSLRTIQMMQQIAANAERAANDSLQMIAADNDKNTTDSTIIQQSIQRDDNTDYANPFEKPKPQESVITKPVAAKPMVVVPKPLKPQINSVPVKKPVIMKPFVSKAIAPRPNPFELKPKQNAAPIQTTKPKILKSTPKKKVVQKPSNDY